MWHGNGWQRGMAAAVGIARAELPAACSLARASDQRPVFKAAQPPRASRPRWESGLAPHTLAGPYAHPSVLLIPGPPRGALSPLCPVGDLQFSLPRGTAAGIPRWGSPAPAHRGRCPTDPLPPWGRALKPSLLRVPAPTDSTAPRASSPAAPACPRPPARDLTCPRPPPTPGAPAARGTVPAHLPGPVPPPRSLPQPPGPTHGAPGRAAPAGRADKAVGRRAAASRRTKGPGAAPPRSRPAPAGAHRPPRSHPRPAGPAPQRQRPRHAARAAAPARPAPLRASCARRAVPPSVLPARGSGGRAGLRAAAGAGQNSPRGASRPSSSVRPR